MKKYKKVLIASYFLTIFSPKVSSAQSRVLELINNFGLTIGLLPRVIFGLAVVYFLWQGAQFVLNAGDEKYREEGKKRLIFGIIVLFVFASIYGILNALRNLVNL